MANLVIKPASGSGNKVIFQNQAGLVDAITVEDSGSTTLAGTANNLGTVTAGTYKGTIHSDTTFPAGHVLQVEHMYTKTYTSFSSTTWRTTHLTDAITVKSATSNIIVHPTLNLLIYPGAVTGWFRVDESTTSLSEILTSYWGSYDEETGGTGSWIYKHDHNQSANTTLTYTINMKCYAAAGSGLRVNDYMTGGEGYSSMTLMEVEA